MISTRKFSAVALFAVIACCTPSRLAAQANQQRGATFGGLAGAIAGGLIGDHNDEAGAGAAIGGVVGAVAGGILGNAADKEAELARQRSAYYHAQQQQYAVQQQAVIQQSAVTLQDVVTMSRSGLSDQVIVNQVRQRGYLGKLTVNDIIALHQQGVSESVITTLQTVGPPQSPPVTVSRPAPTIVERHIHQPGPIIIQEHVLRHYPPPHYRQSHRPTFYYHYRH